MTKAGTGRSAPGKPRSAAPPAAVGKRAKLSLVAAARTTKKAAGKALKKAAAPKMASAVEKAPKASPVSKVAAKGKARSVVLAKAVAGKKAAAAKKISARRSVSRTAVPTPGARRVRAAAAVPRKVPAAAARGHAAQVFTVSHLDQNDFKVDGLRAYARYRDLGIAAATGGLCQAHVIRFTPPCTDEVRKRHLHRTDLQLVYVLQGWMKNEFEGHGEQMMSAGSCWLQPSGIKHTVLDYSADCEVLEIVVPADFKTEDVA